MTSRRDFLEQLTALAAIPALPVPHYPASAAPSPRGFVSLLRIPDRATVDTATGTVVLRLVGTDKWLGDGGIVVTTAPKGEALGITLMSPAMAIKRVQVRWNGDLAPVRLIVGDAWERAYGDLEWRGWVTDRTMPWYFATWNGARTDGYGVRTGANAFCSWSADPRGVTLAADVRSGSVGVQLGERELALCDVVYRAGRPGERAFAAMHAFCRVMCSNPRMPAAPVYGSNDWYWAYGNNSGTSARTDAKRIVELSPTGANRPYAIIDDGWQPSGGHDKEGAGQWDRGNEKFGDMHAVAADMKRAGARPGIWIRPLQAAPDTPAGWRLGREHGTLDPSVPEVRQKVGDDIARLRQWGFELIKHDYSSWDIFGRWGSQMGTAMTRDGWSFAAGASQTTAEIISALYQTIRVAAGESIVIGCNTVSHLSAGVFEMCRIGDDTSGTEWPRTRKMGVNSLAFRGVQQGAFYVADGDCVGVTTAVPWSLTKQWLELVSESGTMTFVSLATDAVGAEQTRALKAALAIAAVPQPIGEPLDWQGNACPARWRLRGVERRFEWWT